MPNSGRLARAYDATALAAIVSAHRMSGSVLVVTGLATLFAADERAPHARRRCIIVQASRPVVGVPGWAALLPNEARPSA